MREICVYDGNLPAWQQMLAGGPSAAFPKEVWLQQMQVGEFAVRFKDFKTGLARTPAGAPVQSSELCRVFDNLEEARADSRSVVNEHWTVRCFIYDHTGAQVDSISNTGELNKFAALAYLRLFAGIGFCAFVGMGLIWVASKIWFIATSASSVQRPPDFGWLYWISYAAAGLLLVALLLYLRLRWTVKRTVSQMQAKLSVAISPEERKRFEELNTFFLSRDSADRERLVKLANEYQEKIRDALKK